MFKLDKLFQPKEEVLLTMEEKGTLVDLMSKNPEMWRVLKKYLYNKINSFSRQMINCEAKNLPLLQNSVKMYAEIFNDFDKIKKDFTNSNKSSKIKTVKDWWHYVTSQDVKDQVSVLDRH